MSKSLATKNVAALVLSVAMIFGVTFAFASPAKAVTIEELQAQINALLAQIAALQGGTTTGGTSTGACTTFTRNHQQGDTGGEVMAIQKFLNANGFTVSASGAGSPGNETSYFGPATKAAVIKFQNMYAASVLTPVGLSAGTGYWGPSSRAKANTMCSGTGTGTGTPITGNGLKVGLASDSPVNVALVINQGIGELGKFTFSNPTSAPITVTSVSFQRIGASTDSVLSNVYLYSGAKRLTDPAGISNSMFNFNNSAGVFTVPAYGSVSVSVRADIGGSSGQQVGVQLNSVAASGALDTSVSFPIVGGIQTISSATIATATWGAVTPSGGTFAPASDTTLFQATLTVNTRPVWLKSVQFENRGSTDDSDFQNLKLFVRGVQVGGTASIMNDKVVFDLGSSPIKLESGASEIRLVGDIVGGSGETFDFQIRRGIDINLVDSELNQNLAPSAPTAVSANNVEGVGLSVVRATNSPTDNVAVAATNVLWARFEARASGDNLKVEEVSLHVDSGTSAMNGTTMDNVRIVLDGAQVGSTLDITSATTTFSLGSSMILQAGKTHVIEVYGDAKDSSGSNYSDGSQRRVGLSIDNADTEGMSSGDRLTDDIDEVEGNLLTVTSSTLTGTKASGYGNQTMIAGTNNAKIGSLILSSGSTEGVNVNTIRIDFSAANAASITDLRLVDNSTGTQIGTTKSSVGTQNIFSVNLPLGISTTKTIDVVANIKSGVNAGPIVATLDVTSGGTGAVTGQSVTISGDADLQTITVASTGTLTAAVGVSPDDANIVAGSSDVKVGSFNFTAVDSSFTVQEIKVKVPSNAATSVSAVTLKYKDAAGADKTATQALTLPTSQEYATATYTGLTFYIPSNTTRTLDVYVNVPSVASGASSGAQIKVYLDADEGFKKVDSAGTSNGTLAASDLNSNGTSGKGKMVVRKTIPTISAVALDSTQLSAGTDKTIGRVKVTADAAGAVDWGQMIFTINKSAAVTLGGTTTVAVYEGSSEVDGDFATTTDSTATFTNMFAGSVTSGAIHFRPSAARTVAAGTSATYELRDTVGGSWSGLTFLDVSIANPTASVVTSNFTTAAGTLGTSGNASFVWSDWSDLSDHASSPEGSSTTDWTNNYLVKTLPTTIGNLSVTAS